MGLGFRVFVQNWQAAHALRVLHGPRPAGLLDSSQQLTLAEFDPTQLKMHRDAECEWYRRHRYPLEMSQRMLEFAV